MNYTIKNSLDSKCSAFSCSECHKIVPPEHLHIHITHDDGRDNEYGFCSEGCGILWLERAEEVESFKVAL